MGNGIHFITSNIYGGSKEILNFRKFGEPLSKKIRNNHVHC
jgi:hypothetical protein